MATRSAVTEFEYQVRRKDGEVIWVSENVRAIRGPDGGVLHSSGAGATKTLQRRLEELRALQVDAILNKPSAAQILSASASALADKPSRPKNSPAQAATARA